MERRARQPGANLYIIAGPTGDILAGNVASVQPGVLDEEGLDVEPFRYQRYTESPGQAAYGGGQHQCSRQRPAYPDRPRSREPEAFRVLVRQALDGRAGDHGLGAVIIWFAIGRNALKRIDRMSAASKKIMAGDLSQRLPVGGSGDEFDRLSVSLNAMLGRIEKLNEGLRQVSDNIAHDLKTPLTRLRNKAADALDTRTTERAASALEGIISESDQLIRTFNAC
jgi:signal transduction histidine kinase